MRAWVWLLAGWIFAVLSGCAASGRSYVAVTTELPPIRENACRVFFYRTDSMLGAAMQPEIRLDNQVVGKSQPGGFFYVDTHPGRHLATSETETEARLEFDADAGQTIYIASSITMGVMVGRVQLNLKREADAVSELSPLRYTGTAAPAVASAGVGQPAPSVLASPAAAPLPRGRVTLADLDALLPPASAGAGAAR